MEGARYNYGLGERCKIWLAHLLLTKIENTRLSHSLSSNQKGSYSTFTSRTSSHREPSSDAPPTK